MADVPGTKTPDDELLSNVPGLDDESDPAAPGPDPATPAEITDPVAPVTTDPAVSGGDGEGKGAGPARGPGDLVDAQGQVIAKGGAERRLYEQAQRVSQENSTLKGRVAELEGQAKAVTDAGSVGTQLGLTPEEITSGAQLIAAYKENPIETIKYLLTQAQAAGHNMEGVGSGTDVGAIKKLIEDAMKPFVDDRQLVLDTQKQREEADKVYNDFMARHPDALVHQDALAQLLEKDTTLNPEAAYFKLLNFYQTKGLDWTKSLDTLQKELKEGKSGAQTSLPAGGANAADVTDTAEVASVDTSLDDIIRGAMKEAGVGAT